MAKDTHVSIKVEETSSPLKFLDSARLEEVVDVPARFCLPVKINERLNPFLRNGQKVKYTPTLLLKLLKRIEDNIVDVMKTICHFLLPCLVVTNTVAMQGSEGAEEEGHSSDGSALVAVPLNDPQDLNQSPKDDSEARPPVDLQAQEELIRSMDRMTDVQTIEDVPFSILETDRGLVKRAFVTSGYYLKQVSGAAAMCWNFARNYTPLSLVQAASVTTASTYAEMITEGDKINFPDIPLNTIFERFATNPDRVKFASYYLREREFPFVGEGFNGVSMGYDGYAVIKDFAFGHRVVRPGDEHKVLSQYKEEKGRTRLDVLIALREHITLMEWLNKRFVRPNPMVLRKLGDPYKDVYGNTCLLYELAADPEGFIIEVMRKPKHEYEQLVNLWQERWRLSSDSRSNFMREN